MKTTTITITQEIEDQLNKRRISKLFDFVYDGVKYSNSILYYPTVSIGDLLLIKVTGNLPIICRKDGLKVSFILFNKYLEIINV